MTIMVDERFIGKAANILMQAAPGAKVFLFGSYAQGQAGPHSDLDFLVVEPQVDDPYQEMVRLRAALRPVLRSQGIPADVLVVSSQDFASWRNTPNTIFYEAATHGRLYE